MMGSGGSSIFLSRRSLAMFRTPVMVDHEVQASNPAMPQMPHFMPHFCGTVLFGHIDYNDSLICFYIQLNARFQEMQSFPEPLTEHPLCVPVVFFRLSLQSHSVLGDIAKMGRHPRSFREPAK